MGALAAWAALTVGSRPAAQQAGSIRGIVTDRDFDVPLAGARVLNVETGQSVLTAAQGDYVLSAVVPGKYTLVFTKEGYEREVRTDVVVTVGQLAQVDASLAGEITEMDEFVVQDILQLGGATEVGLIQLRFESLSLIDSIGADLMSKAAVSDAAAGLRLVAGATVQEGKSAVIRGLPDRYVSTQMNAVRLPSADEDKRAVELDQFPAAVIESIQVSKTFMPDQQGDASGGAVNVKLRGIPDETLLRVKTQLGYNSQVADSDFLTYDGGGVNFLGRDDGDRDIQFDNLGDNWDGAVGVSRDDAPVDYKWAIDAGTRHELASGWTVGGFASFFYEADSSFYDDGIDDSLWVVNSVDGEGLSPEYTQGAPDPFGGGDYKTALYDVTQGTESVQWGTLGTLGIENEDHALALTYLYTHTAEDTATLAEDTRGKEFFFPGYDPDIGSHPGNQEPAAAPYLRTETLEYTERTTDTLQLHGRNRLPWSGFQLGPLDFLEPELDWVLARNSATQDQPDKRQFGSKWSPGSPGAWGAYKPSASFLAGNLQRTWKEIEEEGDQYALNLRFPFEQWSGNEGTFQVGLFADAVDRSYDQESFSNFNEDPIFIGDFEDFWSEEFPSEDHSITDGPPFQDIDYEGDMDVSAWYGMVDLPLANPVSLIGGVRFESTEIAIANFGEANATWLPDGASSPRDLLPGEADVDFDQDDVLPAVGLVYQPIAEITVRGTYSETVARQTFKELTPVLNSDYLGGPVFVGNPELGMSSLQNYDLRLDYAPRPGSLVSVSWFHKDVEDPIEYVQKVATFVYTTAENYPKGQLSGYEVEVRQDLERYSERLLGLSVGANATFIDSEVTLPADEALIMETHGTPMRTRDATQAPDYLYNLYLTYSDEVSGTDVGLFYTFQGDTLIAGAGALGLTTHFVPSVYAKEYGTLNFSLSRRLGKHFVLTFQAKNLTAPDVETVYRSEFIPADTTKTSYSTGREYSLGLTAHL